MEKWYNNWGLQSKRFLLLSRFKQRGPTETKSQILHTTPGTNGCMPVQIVSPCTVHFAGSHSGRNPIQCNVLGFTSRKIKNFLHKICYAMFEIKLNCEKENNLNNIWVWFIIWCYCLYFDDHIKPVLVQYNYYVLFAWKYM